ncbi:glycosyltransferase family 2 protein [Pseudomonas oryzihabitans]|uniref:glycosyltransferase family 2 protein n=1 Tax=Pseudomonas oryzihabitans TaxID=47885 RepID=UPI001F414942|nr:glycosyltransferase family 2 protein [Pseudomonas oryzihabitans]
MNLLHDSILELSSCCEKIVVVDNASLGYEEKAKISRESTLLSLNENLGLAAAQNAGIEIALEEGADAIIFFDQDSVVTRGVVAGLIEAQEEFFRKGQSVVVAPMCFDSRTRKKYPVIQMHCSGKVTHLFPCRDDKPVEVSFLISTGSLIPRSIIEDIGGMRSDFFIDYVDTEWCLRARHKGYQLKVLPTLYLEHSIGDRNFSWCGLSFPIHSPERRYFRIRNSIAMLGLPHVPFLLAIREVAKNIASQLFLGVTIRGKFFSYMGYGVKGIIDGVKLAFRIS